MLYDNCRRDRGIYVPKPARKGLSKSDFHWIFLAIRFDLESVICLTEFIDIRVFAVALWKIEQPSFSPSVDMHRLVRPCSLMPTALQS